MGNMSRLLGDMSVFTMLMTVPQVLTMWVSHQAAGVSVVSWCAQLFQPFFGFGRDCKSAQRTSICHAQDGLC